MRRLTVRQLEVLRVVGAAVDEFEFRHEHALRARGAIQEQRRRLRERSSRMDGEIRDQLLLLRRTADPNETAKFKDLEAQKKAITSQIASAEKAEAESAEKLTRMTKYSAPWRATLEAVLRHTQVTREDAGIPYGREVPRSVQADVVIGGRR